MRNTQTDLKKIYNSDKIHEFIIGLNNELSYSEFSNTGFRINPTNYDYLY